MSNDEIDVLARSWKFKMAVIVIFVGMLAIPGTDHLINMLHWLAAKFQITQ